MSELAEIHGEEIPSHGQLLWHMLAATAARFPGRDAIVASNPSRWAKASSCGTRDDGDDNDNNNSDKDDDDKNGPFERWSYRQLLEEVDMIAHSLGHAGCGGSGTALVAVTHNTAGWGMFLWAAAKLGMVFVPVDPAAGRDELGNLLTTVVDAYSIQIVVVETDETAQRVDAWWQANQEQQRQRHLVRILLSNDDNDDDNDNKADSMRKPPGWLSLAQQISSSPSSSASSQQLPCPMRCQFDGLRAGSSGRSTALVIFTSGTTGTPKACAHTHDNIIAQTHDYDPNPDPAFVDRWLVHTPAHHIFAINNALRAWRLGGAVILPSPVFSVAASLRALVQQRCTIMSATPTLVRAILAQQQEKEHRHHSNNNNSSSSSSNNNGSNSNFGLSIVSLASTLISPDDVRLCTQSLGCRHAIQAYGMSETGPLVSWCRSDPLLVDSFHPGVGKVLPGASVRVCQPGTHRILCLGEVGELHVSGASVIQRYLNTNADQQQRESQSSSSSSSFYTDNHDGRQWLVTGDQARIDKNRVVYILGRYKDLIIRGGENIEPAVIERAITALKNVEVQVVGQTDSIAGQVPVAIVKRPAAVLKSAVFEKAAALGPKYTLAAVYDASELGYVDMPVTSLNKPRRQLLAAALAELIQSREQQQQEKKKEEEEEPSPEVQSLDDNNEEEDPVSVSDLAKKEQSAAADSPLVEKLATIWHDVCGVKPEPRQSVHTFADSILLLQFCDRVFRQLQLPLYLQDLLDCEDLVSQSELLVQRRQQQQQQKHTAVDLEGDDSQPGKEQAASATPAAESASASASPRRRRELSSFTYTNDNMFPEAQLQFALDALGSALPSGTRIDFLFPLRTSQHRMVNFQRPQSYHIRLAYYIEELSTAIISEGVQSLLYHYPMLRSTLVQLRPVANSEYNHVWHHAICSKHIIQYLVYVSQVNTEDEIRSRLCRDTSFGSSSDPETYTSYGSNSPLRFPYVFRADIINCLDTDKHFLILCFNHAVVDAMFLWNMLRNLDYLLHQQQYQAGAKTGTGHEIMSTAAMEAAVKELPEPCTYLQWTSFWYENCDNYRATLSVKRIAARLRGISRFTPDVLFPPQRAVGWMIADDSGSALFEMRKDVRRNRRRQNKSGLETREMTDPVAAVNGSSDDNDDKGKDVDGKVDRDDVCFPRCSRIVRLPHLAELQSSSSSPSDGEGPGIPANILARCAIILFNTRQTQSPYAVFTSWEAGRSWPFVPMWVQQRLPPAMTIDGPTAEWRLNMYRARISDEETVLQFLRRIRAEEAELAAYVHAPWDKVKAALGEEAAIVEDASFRQGFVWDLTLGMSAMYQRQQPNSDSIPRTSYVHLRPVSRHDWPDCGLFWNVFKIDTENIYFIASWDSAQLTAAEVEGYSDQLAEIFRVLTDHDNWNRPLKEVLDGM